MIKKWFVMIIFTPRRVWPPYKFLVFWLVYVQHKNIIAIGWQQPREQKHVGCQFALLSPINSVWGCHGFHGGVWGRCRA